jgi:hypothetical protein
MPYGLPKKKGGDTPRNDAWMEHCVADVTAKGHSRLSAILICKAQFSRKKHS